ncbi:MAG TPA: hypothetical protein PKE12_15740 [Kiritimatiellia bacterium]|nr:hypothetical protein [Kiritimatiellia bacterium]
MKKYLRGCLVAVVLMAGGCVPTLNTIFTSGDIAYDPALEGVWRQAETTWTLSPYDAGVGRYKLRTEMKNQPPAEWYATLGSIGTNRFLELLPLRPNEIHPNTFYGGHFVPLRSFWKVLLQGDSLTLTPLSTQWLDALIKQDKVNIQHAWTEGGLLFLTASTQELQDFIARYANDPGAFPSTGDAKGITFVRGGETAQPHAEPVTDELPWSPPKDWENTGTPDKK